MLKGERLMKISPLMCQYPISLKMLWNVRSQIQLRVCRNRLNNKVIIENGYVILEEEETKW